MNPKRAVFTVRNADRGTVLAVRARLASSFVSRLFGLMGRRRVEEGGGLLLTRSASIHSFFMRFRFDAVFLARDDTVVKVVPAMRQWWVAFGGRGARDVLELPAGLAAATGTQPGDQLVFEDPA
ncbi:MAG TPA: DUF192 domain-containing protein [Dehalococcoidia bacterium]|nr:DUF192 domain-containing protein [Dehalococcoidia bacterium]